jgi:hypothetical protein
MVVERVPCIDISELYRSFGLIRGSAPVSVENSGSVAAKQRDLVRSLAPLLQRNDSKGTTSRSIPVDRDVLWVDLFAIVSVGALVIV